MPAFITLLEAAARMAAAARDTEIAKHETVSMACKMVAGKAKDLMGVPHGWWPPLAPATLARKDNINTPLLETGEMRDSIEWNADGDTGYVGSNNEKAVWQELGTSRGVPPRSFLAAAAMLEGPKVEKMATELIGAAIMGRLENGHQVRELFHLARELGHILHDVKESAQDFLEPDDDKNGRP